MLTERALAARTKEFALRDPSNRLSGDTFIYDPPLLGFASASDHLFLEFKQEEIIGEIYRLPTDWLPGAVTVISYFLPFSKEVRASNQSPGAGSLEWLHGRFRGEEFNNNMRRLLINEIETAGGRAIAPVLEPTMVTDFTTYRSSWSERHAAYAAGLGTFSLNKGLITEKGMAGRFGSVITDLLLPPTPRPYSSPFEYCIECGSCIDRCPVKAISLQGKDKVPCHQYLFFTDPLKEYCKVYGYPYSACGKCQTNVPCEDRIP